MVFNLQKFLIENRLTKRARLNEDAMTKTDAEQQAMGAEEDDNQSLDSSLDTDMNTSDDSLSDPENLKFDTVNARPYADLPEPPRTPKGKQLGTGGGGSGIEVNPDAGRTLSNKPVRDLEKKSAKLKSLEDLKDRLVMQLKSGQLKLDQYKQAIGNIPAQIIKLRLDIQKQMDPVIGDTEEEEEI